MAPRAAAFDKRITKIIAWSVFPCFQDVIVGMQKPIIQRLFYLLMKLHVRALINLIFRIKSNKEPMIEWGLQHGMYAKVVLDAICSWIDEINERKRL